MPESVAARTSTPSELTVEHNVARALAALARGLVNSMSESSDDVFTPFVAHMAPGTALSSESFKAAVGIASRYHIDLRGPDDFFQMNEDPQQTNDAAMYVVLDK